MNMPLALPTQKTLFAQFRPAALAVVVVIVAAVLIPVRYPVHVSHGVIKPTITSSGENAEVHWVQDWRELCPVTVTREFIGSDGFRKSGAPYLLQPPRTKGVSPYQGPIVIPGLPAGEATYHAIIEPHCWIDRLWQRSYSSPDVPLMIVPTMPPGPR